MEANSSKQLEERWSSIFNRLEKLIMRREGDQDEDEDSGLDAQGRLKIPIFYGENTEWWVSEAEMIFSRNQLSEAQKIESAVACFGVESWDSFQKIDRQRPVKTWEELKSLMWDQFRMKRISIGEEFSEWKRGKLGKKCDEQKCERRETGKVNTYSEAPINSEIPYNSEEIATIAGSQKRREETTVRDNHRLIKISPTLLSAIPDEVLQKNFFNGLKPLVRTEDSRLKPQFLGQIMESAQRGEDKNNSWKKAHSIYNPYKIKTNTHSPNPNTQFSPVPTSHPVVTVPKSPTIAVLLPTKLTVVEKNPFQQPYRSTSDQQQRPNLLELHQQTRFLTSSLTELYEQGILPEEKKITDKKREENGLELMAEFQIKEFMGLVLELAQLGEGSNEVVKQAQLNFGPNGSKLNGLNPPISYSIQFSNYQKPLNSPLLLTINSKPTASSVLCPATMVREITPESQATTESVYIAALALGIEKQWTNIIRDVGEDARRGGIHLPHDEIDVDDYNNFTRGGCLNKLKKMLAPPIAYAKSLLQKSDISQVGATGYGIALYTILVIVAQLSRSVHFNRLQRPFSVVTMNGVLARKMGWLLDELTKTATIPTLRTRWISRRR